MIIPDKNYYLENSEILTLDYDYLYNEVGDLVDNQIDVKDLLELKDYYETDTHWKQENIEKVIKRMSDTMNFKYSERKFEKQVYDKFYGVYYGESAINRKPENITYLTNDVIDNAKVFYLENDKLTAVYNKENLWEEINNAICDIITDSLSEYESNLQLTSTHLGEEKK